MSVNRCLWPGTDPLYIRYHDEEWGVPVHDDRELFEMLVLEGAQAGLSWITILRRREGYRRGVGGVGLRRAWARGGRPPPPAPPPRGPGRDRRVAGHEPRAAGARLQVRRPHHLLRLHAGGG